MSTTTMIAGRLMMPCAIVPSASVIGCNGEAISCGGRIDAEIVQAARPHIRTS